MTEPSCINILHKCECHIYLSCLLIRNILGEEVISIRQRKPYDSFAVRYVSFVLGYSHYGTYGPKWVDNPILGGLSL